MSLNKISNKTKNTKYSWFKRFFSKKSNRIATVIAAVVLLTASIFGLGFFSLNKSDQKAKADDTIIVTPNGDVRVNFWYGNTTDEDQGNLTGNMKVILGRQFQIYRIYDIFDTNGDGDFTNETEYEICDALFPISGVRRSMNYIPRSANNNQACSGQTVATQDIYEPIALPLGKRETRENFGRVTILARLNPNILNELNIFTGENYKIGDILSVSDNLQGASASFRSKIPNRSMNEVNASISFIIGDVITTPLAPEDLLPGGLILNQDFATATGLQCQDGIVVSGTTTCSGTLPEGFTAPTTPLELNVQGQLPVECIFAANGKDFTCSNMPAGNTAGEFPIQASVNASTPTNTGEVVQVLPKPLTEEDIPALEIVCQEAVINATTNCTFVLPDNTTLPNNFDLIIGNGQPGGECVENAGTVTCSNVPTGSQTGQQPIQADLGTGGINSGETANILPEPDQSITPEDLLPGGLIPNQDFATATGLQCQDGIVVSGATTCTGTLPEGFTAPATGSLALNVQGQNPVNCIFAANGKDFTCSNMPVGNTAGDFPIQSQVNGSTPTNTGEVVSVEEMPPDPEIIITEINWAGSSASTKDQWVEFRNTGTTPTDLTQVIIVGIGTDAAPAIRINSDTSFSTGTYQNGVFTAINNSAGTCLTTTIPASGYFLISAYNKNNAKTTLNIQPDCYFTNENLIDINKNGETLTIYKNTTTNILDQVGF